MMGGLPTILLVDDNLNNLKVLGNVLKEDYRIAICKDSTKAFDLAFKILPDLILLDIMMPDVDGFEVCKQLKANDNTGEIPIIFLSAKTEVDDIVKAFEYGGVDYVTKPFKQSELKARVMTQISLVKAKDELIRNKEELQVEKKKAEEANDTKSIFLANMSHEMRTPLHAINGMVELLSQQINEDVHSQYIKGISSASRQLLNTINDILDFAKIESGKIDLQNAPFNINNVINDVVYALNFLAQKKDLVLINDIDIKIHDSLLGDKYKLKQVLTNILGNAIKFTNEGHVSLKCTLDSETQDEVRVKFIISDTGIGIHKDDIDNIFESFNQSKQTRNVYGGSGLGLAIAKELLELQGGSISIESEYNKGSIVTFFIKYKKADAVTIEKEVISDNEKCNLTGLKVLVAEDYEINQLFITTMLQNAGCEVIIVEDGKQAVESFAINHFDIIFMDKNMPVMDGINSTKKIRAINNDVPIIGLTADARKESIDQCINAGMNDVLVKPFETQGLLELLIKYIDPNDFQNDKPVNKTEQNNVKSYDLKPLLSMFDNDISQIEKMLKIFIKGTPITLHKIKILLEKGSYEQASNLIHKIKSSINLIGVKQIKKDLDAIEYDYEKYEKEILLDIFNKISDTIAVVIDQLEKEIN